MSLGDKFKEGVDKVKGKIGDNSEKITSGIDKGVKSVNEKTKGKYTGKVDSAAQKMKDAVDKTKE